MDFADGFPDGCRWPLRMVSRGGGGRSFESQAVGSEISGGYTRGRGEAESQASGEGRYVRLHGWCRKLHRGGRGREQELGWSIGGYQRGIPGEVDVCMYVYIYIYR